MTKEEYLAEVIELVSQDKTIEALNLLEECAREYDLDDLFKFVIANQARITRIKESEALGVVDSEEYKIECNRINAAILESIEVLRAEEKELQHKEAIRYGRIAHNIPPVMSKGIARMCKVRIARVDELLYDKNFNKEDTSTPEPLEITDVMEVELYDPSGGQYFLVEAINREIEQPVEDHAHTEWKFRVTPLIVGAHELELRAFLHKQKGTKELSFETQIEVVAYDGEFYAKQPLPAWKTDKQVINFVKDEDSKGIGLSAKKQYDDPSAKDIDINPTVKSPPAPPSKSRLLPFLGAGFLRAAAMIGGALLIGTSGYFIYRYFSSSKDYVPPSDVEFLKVTLKIDTQLNIRTIRFNSEIKSIWTANPDSSEIYVPDLPEGIYYVLVEGHNGNCEKWISLNRESTPFALMCYIAKPEIPVQDTVVREDTVKVVVPPTPAPPQSRSYKLNLITPFKDPTILIDGKKSILKYKTAFEKDMYTTTLKLKEGKYTIQVNDPAKQYTCSGKPRRIVLQKDADLLFTCTKLPPPPPPKGIFTVTYTIMDVGEATIEGIQVYVDGNLVRDREISGTISKRKNLPFKQKNLLIRIPNIEEGFHTFQVQFKCNYINGPKQTLQVNKENTTIADQSNVFACIN